MRIGIGYDSHCFKEGEKLVLGGIELPFDRGLKSHSDGDVLCHAIIDALLGALGEGDIGHHFPDTDTKWKHAVSTDLLARVVNIVRQKCFHVVWIDSVLILEQPKIAPYIDAMKESLSKTGIPKERINIKAKTNENMGFVGREEGVVAQAVCLITNNEIAKDKF